MKTPYCQECLKPDVAGHVCQPIHESDPRSVAAIAYDQSYDVTGESMRTLVVREIIAANGNETLLNLLARRLYADGFIGGAKWSVSDSSLVSETRHAMYLLEQLNRDQMLSYSLTPNPHEPDESRRWEVHNDNDVTPGEMSGSVYGRSPLEAVQRAVEAVRANEVNR